MGQNQFWCLLDGLNSIFISVGTAKSSVTWEFHVGNHETFLSGARKQVLMKPKPMFFNP